MAEKDGVFAWRYCAFKHAWLFAVHTLRSCVASSSSVGSSSVFHGAQDRQRHHILGLIGVDKLAAFRFAAGQVDKRLATLLVCGHFFFFKPVWRGVLPSRAFARRRPASAGRSSTSVKSGTMLLTAIRSRLEMNCGSRFPVTPW
jgi:hypothetical protein